MMAVALIAPSMVAAQGSGPEPDTSIDAAVRTRVIDGVLKKLNEGYVFPDVAKKMEEAIRKRVQAGEYGSLTSATAFAGTLTRHLQEVSHDKHLRVRYRAQEIPQENGAEPTAEERERMRTFGKRFNHGFEKVERMQGNVGYLDLRGFFDATEVGETAAAAMGFLADTDALIIDLRQNGGGDPACVQVICSYLFGPEPVHLNDIYWRPTNDTRQFWTLPSLPGRRYTDRDVYVLTSKNTFSGAEEFTYNLKNLKRAVIVGETTGGGANPGDFQRVDPHFGVFVPSGRAINPITKTNWEGTGVTPDVPVPAEKALPVAYLAALRNLVAKSKDPERNRDLKQLIDDKEKEMGAKKASAR